MAAKELRAHAREKLKGNWGSAVLTGLVATVLGGAAITQTSSVSSNVSDEDIQKYQESLKSFEIDLSTVPTWVWAVIGAVTAVLMVWGIAAAILGGVTRMGYCRYNMNLLDGKAQFSDLFSYYSTDFLKGFVTRLLVSIFITLWTLLLVIPGIIKSYAYSMTFYILADNPDLDAMEAIRKSGKMMKGHKWELFCLQFSFIGWMILSAFTAGIGGLFLNPYMEAATAAFYRNLSGGAKEEVVLDYEPAARPVITEM